jgi:nitrilase
MHVPQSSRCARAATSRSVFAGAARLDRRRPLGHHARRERQGDAAMKCSLVQMNSIGDKARNIAMARALIEQAVAEEKPDWVLLPETFDWAGGTAAQRLAAAETIPGGPAYAMCQEMARTHRIFVHAGSINEKVPGEDKVYNTTVVFDRAGEPVARYRKIHLFDVTTPDGVEYRESAHVAPGDAVVTYDCEGVTVGAAICYDLRFPELFQALAKKGAQLIALPAAFTLQTGKDHWEVLIRARAIENETYFAASAQCGAFAQGNSMRQTYGHSMMVDPWGHVVARASDGPGVVAARVDPRRVAQVRAQIPVHQHRRLPMGA